MLLDLVIDAAGKVRTAKPIGKVDKDMLDAIAGWKFIPTFKNGHAVACRAHLAVYWPAKNSLNSRKMKPSWPNTVGFIIVPDSGLTHC